MDNDYFEKNADDLLFHYTSREIAIEKILHDGKLRLSPLREFDDPKESENWRYSFDHCRDDICNDTASAIYYFLSEVLPDEFFVACFCRSNMRYDYPIHEGFNFGYAKSRMWSQYADKHTGVCLVFSKIEIKNYLESKSTEYFDDNVCYDNEYKAYDLHSVKLNHDDTDKAQKDFLKHLLKNKEPYFLWKFEDFKNENEYRFVIRNSKKQYVYIPIRKALKGIIIGHRFPEAYKQLINHFASKLNIPLKQVLWEKRGPELLNVP